MTRGLFIVLEGIEGAGKSEAAAMLGNRFQAMGQKVIVTREPGGTRIGELIRDITHDPKNIELDAVAEAYLMAASRAQHVREKIEPALNAGTAVIADRFVDSSIAYQGYGRKLGAKVIKLLNTLAVDGASPDITILLNVPPDVGLMRRDKTQKTDRLDMQQKDFYKRVYAGYLALAKNNPSRYVVVDATKSKEEVAFSVWKAVSLVINKRNGKE